MYMNCHIQQASCKRNAEFDGGEGSSFQICKCFQIQPPSWVSHGQYKGTNARLQNTNKKAIYQYYMYREIAIIIAGSGLGLFGPLMLLGGRKRPALSVIPKKRVIAFLGCAS